MAQQNARMLYGSTNDSSCVPDCAATAAGRVSDRACGALPTAPAVGPVYDSTGRLVLADSFRRDDASVLDNLAGCRLADALVVWECYEGKRLAAAPLLLRFERFDLVFSTGADDAGAFWRGTLDTECGLRACAGATEADAKANERTCPAWVSEPSLWRLAGAQVVQAPAREKGRCAIAFDEAELVLEAKGGEVSYAVVAL